MPGTGVELKYNEPILPNPVYLSEGNVEQGIAIHEWNLNGNLNVKSDVLKGVHVEDIKGNAGTTAIKKNNYKNGLHPLQKENKQQNKNRIWQRGSRFSAI